MRLINDREQDNRLTFWVAFRYIHRNCELLREEKYSNLYRMMKGFFYRMYWQGGVEETKEQIERLFELGSEDNITIDIDMINRLVDEFEKNPYVLR